MTPLASAPEDSSISTHIPGLPFESIKALFPHVLDVRAEKVGDFDPTKTPVAEWFRTDSVELADSSTLVRIIGRAYFLKYGKTIDALNIKQHLKKSRSGSAETPVRLNELGQLVSDAVDALAPASVKKKEKKKSPHLTYIKLQAHFPHLFGADAAEKFGHETSNTAVDAWFQTASTELVDPAALRTVIGRAFWLQHRTTIHPRYVNAHLNGSAEKPVPLNELSGIIKRAVETLIEGPTEKPDPAPRDIPADRVPFHNIVNLGKGFERKEGEIVPREETIHQLGSPEFTVNAAVALITPLKGTAPDKAKGNEREICAKVFSQMQGGHPVSDEFLRDCIAAAWDRLGINGAGYEGDKKSAKPSGRSTPTNRANRI